MKTKEKAKCDVLVGIQLGDEGKGKIIDVIAEIYYAVARFQGGPNAGHTLYSNGEKYVLHTMPSGIFSGTFNIVGGNVLINPIGFKKEVEMAERAVPMIKSMILIAKTALLIIPTHKLLDKASETSKGKQKIGSTGEGVGPAYMDKTGRNALKAGYIPTDQFKEQYNQLKEKHFRLLKSFDFPIDYKQLKKDEKEWFKSIDFLKSLTFIDCDYYINQMFKKGKRILAEGAQGTWLDIDFGTYPFVTSSNTISAGVCTGLGISPHRIGEVIGVLKVYCTRVGNGPFPTELFDSVGEKLRKKGKEFGATTGRPRRCGWLDLPMIKKSIMINGVTRLALTKLDVLDTFDEIKICTHYLINGRKTDQVPFNMNIEKIVPIYKTFEGWKKKTCDVGLFSGLHENAQKVLNFIKDQTGILVKYISTGKERNQVIIN